MKAVILCGGKGTRMRDASEALPKPLLPIGGKPMVWHIMRHYAKFGIKDFVLCLGYKGEKFKEFFLNFHTQMYDFTLELNNPGQLSYHDEFCEFDWKVTLCDTGEDTMTASRLRKVRRFLENEDDFCLTYGDGLSDVDINALLAHHRRQGCVGTLTAVHTRGRFGEVLIEEGRVCHFNEKPYQSRERINGGFMVFDSRRIWDYIDASDDRVLETDLLMPLMRQGQLAAYTHDGFWQCMDSPREYDLLNTMWNDGEAPWK